MENFVLPLDQKWQDLLELAGIIFFARSDMARHGIYVSTESEMAKYDKWTTLC